MLELLLRSVLVEPLPLLRTILVAAKKSAIVINKKTLSQTSTQ
jgi:hypothetical protein